MTPFLPVRDTANSSSFMICLLSSLHFILWDSWLHLWEFWTYGKISTVLCGLSNFCNQFQFFLVLFFSLACWSFLPFSFSTQLCLPVSPDPVNPMFQEHTASGEAIFSCQPANLLYLRKMRAKEKSSDAQALAGRREKAQQREHPWSWDCMSAKKRGPFLCLHLMSPQDGAPQHMQ